MNLTSARNHYDQQQRLAALAVRTARRKPADAARVIITHQFAATALAVESSARMLTEQGMDDSGESLNPTAFTSGDATTAMLDEVDTDQQFDRLVATLVSDAGRAATGAFIATRRDEVGHVRYLRPPSCERCTILAGRWYRWSDYFQRHPLCDCVMVPASAVAAPDLVSDPMEAFENGQIRGMSQARAQAIRDGGDINQVVNSTRGMTQTTTIRGTRFNFTTEGTTVRGVYGKSAPASGAMEKQPGTRYRRSTKSRLTPDTIYRVAEDRAHAIRLLNHYGYII